MPIYRLSRHDLTFPPQEHTDPSGVIAVGGDYSVARMLEAYCRGIFPWPMPNLPIPVWFCPDPRCVLEPTKAHLPRSLRKKMRARRFEVRCDTAFSQVLEGCASTPRAGQRGTWLIRSLRRGLEELHGIGIAHSVEAWDDGELVGGLYGLSLGGAFFGESMFARVPDASKVAFASLLGHFVSWGFPLVDCQVKTEHLARFGAEDWPRAAFLDRLTRALELPTKQGKWKLELDTADAEALVPRNPAPPEWEPPDEDDE